MKCVFCGGKSEVKDTANQGRDVYRRRKCLVCDSLFYTREAGVPSDRGKAILNAKCDLEKARARGRAFRERKRLEKENQRREEELNER